MTLSTKARSTRVLGALPALAALSALTGCGTQGGDAEYGTKDHAITVDAGKKFTLNVPANPGMGQDWYLADPHPDGHVLKYRGKRKDFHGTPLDGGSDGTQYFDFTAVASGTTEVKLLYCVLGRCPETGRPATGSAGPGTASPSPSAAPTATGKPGTEPAFFVYDITVR
ncbi:protease inhibitor I42 family protein [Streptomyces sp. NPDC007971]|uniref:protease inhibitor I42 family protein n=1 Tax=Streptomyces sp. NPDC007971 TaxID=3364799 RepID=UPI0036E6B33C